MCAKMVKTPNMDDCNELKNSVKEVEAGVTKTLVSDLLASCIENAVHIGSRKENGCDARRCAATEDMQKDCCAESCADKKRMGEDNVDFDWMSLDKQDAGGKFWANAELVEKVLLPCLDTESTKNLAKAHGFTLKILGKEFAWDKLVNRAFPLDVESGIVRDNVSLAVFLSEIVSMAKSSKLPRQDTNWGEMELALLHALCKIYANTDEHSGIYVNCSCLKVHHVSFMGFLILEKVEAKLESAEQKVLKVVSHRLLEEPLLHALCARVLRQDARVEEFFLAHVCCNNKKSAKSWAVLVNETNNILDPECDCTGVYKWWVYWQMSVTIKGDIGAEGWAAVRSIAERISAAGVTNIFVDSGRIEMAQGSRGDMEAIWKVAALWTVDRDSGRGQWTVDGGQGRGQWSGKSEQESQEELRMFLDDLSFVNSV